MRTWSTMENEPPRCQVCFAPRDEHAQKQHEFSTDGQLKPKTVPKPPQARVQELNPGHLVIRLLAVLRERNVLTEADIMEVLGAGARSSPADRAEARGDSAAGGA